MLFLIYHFQNNECVFCNEHNIYYTLQIDTSNCVLSMGLHVFCNTILSRA